jgi:hypothetical protein
MGGIGEVFNGCIQRNAGVVFAGPSLSGKSSLITKILKNADRLYEQVFDRVYWFYGEPTALIDKLPREIPNIRFTFIEGLPEDFTPYIQPNEYSLFVIDDLMKQACDSKAVLDLFTNKVQHADLSCYLSLQTCMIPGKQRTALLRCAHILFLLNNPLDQGIAYSIAHKVMPHDRKTFMDIYHRAVSRPYGYLMVVGTQNIPEEARLRSDIFEPVQRVFSKLSLERTSPHH